jgi:hypothetical protein
MSDEGTNPGVTIIIFGPKPPRLRTQKSKRYFGRDFRSRPPMRRTLTSCERPASLAVAIPPLLYSVYSVF